VTDERGGRVVIVTGANRGIGLELTRQLAARGDTVVLGSRDAGQNRRPVPW
jgi:NAD(P)-dependent dehydrogenase (short-subunit alcohol dehydrogenase family)